MRNDSRVAIVSGAGSGIGLAIAEGFAREGGSVVLLGRTREKLEQAASSIPAGRSAIVAARHEDPAGAAEAVRTAVERFGGLDVLVNNAGVFIGGSAAETSPGAWDEALAVNLTGPFLLTREALPHLRCRKGAAIVNIASTLALRPIPGAMPYCVAKAGLVMLTLSTAAEEAPNGVRVNCVCPGVVDTPIHRQRAADGAAVERFLEAMGKLHPLGRIGKPGEVAAMVLFLASADAAWTTGAIVPVDGGILLKNDQ